VAAEAFAGVRSAVDEAQRYADIVVFSIHWGPNMRARPTRVFQAFARQVIDAGADIFWGHSAHVVQGIELWNRGVILYDTGDFIDDYAVDAVLRNDLSALFLVHITPTGAMDIELLPVQIDDMQVNVARGDARELLGRRLATLCAEMGTELVAGPHPDTVAIRALAKSAQ
jgi:poly-gamma-glutamate synthesis protein (capsule biosynthesis protein)